MTQASTSENSANTLIAQIDARVRQAFADAGLEPIFGQVRVSDRPDLADFQCNGALALAKKHKRNPIELGESLAASLQHEPLFEVTFVKPGFLNFKVKPQALIEQIGQMQKDPRSLVPLVDGQEVKNVLLDYGGPNLAKEMHVGHLRSSIIGQALKTLIKFAGHKTVADVHLGDWGLQMGQLISYMEDIKPELLSNASNTEHNADLAFTMSDLQTWYPQASALSKADPEFQDRARKATAALQAGEPSYMAVWGQIREASLVSLKRDFGWLGVDFDQWNGESRYQVALDRIVGDLQSCGTATMDDGALIVPLPDEMKVPPLMLRTAKGAYGYGATDLATLNERMSEAEFKPDSVLYVVDGRQSLHFKQVFKAAELAGLIESYQVEHVAFGTVNGTDGKPFKTRAGGVMRLHDLFETMTSAARVRLEAGSSLPAEQLPDTAVSIAQAAIKFGELCHDREKDYVFDVDQFVQFEGKTGPYLQYTAVRLSSLASKAAEMGLQPGKLETLGQGARSLILTLDEFPAQFQRAIDLRKPNLVANHCYKLAESINAFYHVNRILADGVSKAEAESHLALLKAARQQLVLVLGLLGIPVPEAM